MNLLTHFRLAVQTWLGDLFDEEAYLPEAARSDKVTTLLTEAQAALNLLRANLVEAAAQHKRTELEWLELTAQAQALEEAIDDDLRMHFEASARAKSIQLVALKEHLQLVSQVGEQSLAAVNRLQVAVELLQRQLDTTRRQRLALNERGRLVDLLISLDRLERQLGREESLLNENLQAHEAEVLQKEDWLTAREEWKNDSHP